MRPRKALAWLIAFHVLIIIASNYLVQLPFTLFGFHTTWGAFSFPFIFLASDLTVRLLGKQTARKVIARVMIPALLVSYIISVLFEQGAFHGFEALGQLNSFVLRISLASFFAYAGGQFLDIQVFDRLRKLSRWWIAPTASMIFGNLMDTAIFFSVAFWRSSNSFMAEHWMEIAAVDYAVKVTVCVMLFVPLYGLVLNAILRLLGGHRPATA